MFWNDLWKHMYQTYYSQPPHRDHNFPCSFTSIMNEGNAAAYYSRLWSDVSCGSFKFFCNFSNFCNKSLDFLKFLRVPFKFVKSVYFLFKIFIEIQRNFLPDGRLRHCFCVSRRRIWKWNGFGGRWKNVWLNFLNLFFVLKIENIFWIFRYKETYLTIGGARKARDVFKLFRNRDLEFDHIGKFYNLDWI